MRRAIAVLLFLSIASCGKTPAERGALIFRPSADKVGEAEAADLKAKSENAYQQYLKETGSKDEVELGRILGKHLLDHYAAVLSLSESEERDFKAGKFKDVENRKTLNGLISKFVDGKGSTSKIGRLIILKSQVGVEWNTGLQLELALRILKSELGAD